MSVWWPQPSTVESENLQSEKFSVWTRSLWILWSHFIPFSCSSQQPPVCLSVTQQLPMVLAAILSAYTIYSNNSFWAIITTLYLYMPPYMTACLALLFASHFLPVCLFFFSKCCCFIFYLFFVSLLENVNAMEAGYMLVVLTNSKFSNICSAGKVTYNF